MTIENNPKDQWVKIVEDYLRVAKLCIDAKSADGFIPNGYSATLLLLCATDAIGHGLLPVDHGRSSRLDVLLGRPFDLKLNLSQIENLRKFFRNGLAHVGVLAPDVHLAPEEGKPFDFDPNDMLILIRVPALYEVVKTGWQRRDKSIFNAELHPAVLLEAQKITHLPGYVASLNPGASGRTQP